jgi:hypothetical protein
VPQSAPQVPQPAPPEPIVSESPYIEPTGPIERPTGPIEPTGPIRQPESAGFSPDFSREISKKVYTFPETYCLKGPKNFD